MSPVAVRFEELVERYDGFLFDAYGVLVDSSGALAGAAAALARVRAAGKALRVVTNDASRLPPTAARRFARVGLAIGEDEVVSSGMLLRGFVEERGLRGARAIVLGTEDAAAYAAAAGLDVRDWADGGAVDAIVVGDDAGFAFTDGLNAALTAAVHALDAARALALVCPNPDLLYPRGGRAYGVTAGAISLMLETALRRIHPGAPGFTYLGKPHAGLFELARAGLPAGARLVMIGDQLETDIAGARAAGIDAALVTGVSRWRDGAAPPELAPQWLLDAL